MIYQEEMKIKFPNRPWVTKPTWELRNMVKALRMLPWLNTPEQNQRLAQAQAELIIRKTKVRVRNIC